MTKKKKEIDWRIICVGLLCLTGIEICALSNGINGILLSSILSIISLAIGITIPLDKIIKLKGGK